jgi:hypothetical protein
MDECSLIVSEIDLQATAILVFNSRPDRRLLDPASVQVDADVLADFEFSLWLLRFARHAGNSTLIPFGVLLGLWMLIPWAQRQAFFV